MGQYSAQWLRLLSLIKAWYHYYYNIQLRGLPEILNFYKRGINRRNYLNIISTRLIAVPTGNYKNKPDCALFQQLE